MKTYLKTYFYVDHELQFIASNLKEAYDHIDGFIINEFNRTHTGREKQFIGWEKLKNSLPDSLIDKVIYRPIDISKFIVEAYENEELIHQVNEPVMRSIFIKDFSFDDDDIIVSVDADEVIYKNSYPKIKDYLKSNNCCSLNLHQFFYKKNYLWKDKDFVAPTAAKYSYFKNKFPCNLRYEGTILPFKAGCHFSWCMSVDEMIYKLHTYGHTRYRFCADKDLLQNAIEKKLYPFDTTVQFNIEEISLDSDILPTTIRNGV